jgi:tetratricopeptide (TPR) repeat protein
MSTEQNPKAARAAQLLSDGYEAREKARLEAAHTNFAMSLAEAREAGDKALMGRALVALADLAFHFNPYPGRSPFELRKDLAEEALALFQQIGDKAGEIRARRVLASVCGGRKPLEQLRRSLELAEELGDKKAVADTLERMGATIALTSKPKALGYKEKALAIYQEIGDKAGEAQAHFSLAVQFMVDDLARMRKHGQTALALYRELGREERVAEMLMFFTSDEMPLEEQEANWTETREICRRLRIDIWEASALDRLAEIAEERGDSERAVALRSESAAIRPPELEPDLSELEEAMKKGGKRGLIRALKRTFFGDESDNQEKGQTD